MYTCKRCGYKASTKGNLCAHLNRKKVCEALLEDVERSQLCNELKKPKEIAASCEFCKQTFSHKSNYSRHKKICKEWIINKDLIEENRKLKEENALLKKTNIVNNNTTNNTTNNIVIHNFYNFEDISYIGPTVYKDALKTMDISQLFEDMHFNPEHPENHNIRVRNVTKKILEYYSEGRWITPNILLNCVNQCIFGYLKPFFERNIEEFMKELKEEDWSDPVQYVRKLKIWFDKVDEEEKKTIKRSANHVLNAIIRNKTIARIG